MIASELVRDAVRDAAQALARSNTTRLLERDLEGAVASALENLAAESKASLTVETQRRINTIGFAGVGPVDVALSTGNPYHANALIEVKWGVGTLLEVAWDVVKLAVAHREERTESAFVIAGAPSSRWKVEAGREHFEMRTRDAGDFMVVYDDLFAFARRNQKCRPRRIPANIETTPVVHAELSVEGKDWEIRAVEIRSGGKQYAVNFDEDGRELSRDRADKFTSFHVDWKPRREPGEGVDADGGDRGFHREMLEDDG